ncbi:hypothetical protein AGDE_06712 [Angomonas deanei]|uniref:Vps52 / Sac2 family, putative n=1 Tax=Angomonas deanei TaxID=59799 RepID=A0A7G2C7T5_9TRYP|nr:hypothetical protein AGDE_06712 [Angomonas deanei]CAD2215890.1 Vps52 / Sac2 family, putative [Angomonas deanei]|eukprot:EPY36848.1 hypothetical protein AGDE_06712 [Angomonas deanei]
MEFDLEDLESIHLDDDFITANWGRKYDENDVRESLQSICAEFVNTFLSGNSELISSMHESLNGCLGTLTEMESVLETFIEQFNVIKKDIGDVKETLSRSVLELNNVRNTEKVLYSVIHRLVLPPDVVQVLTQSNEEQFGTQFEMCVRKLLRFLNQRNGTWQSSPRSRATSATQLNDKGEDREVKIQLKECKVYTDLMNILDCLTLYTCIRIKNNLSKKLLILTVKNTNVCIQQEHSLKQYSFFVYFLRSSVTLLRHAQSAGIEGERQMTLVPYRIVKALYHEFRVEYCIIMSNIYIEKMKDYVFACNSMEYPTSPKVAVNFFGGNVLPKLQFNYLLPNIVDNVTPDTFALAERGAIFQRMFAPPLIPSIEKSSKRQHSYEETFRSTISLLCDIVTHEYLFTFQFFTGDTSVYVEVFKPTVQFIVDYICEVVLVHKPGEVQALLNTKPYTSVNTNAKKDCYGLLIMIRICHEFRAFMRFKRKLTCLDAFFDSILVLLWPAFKQTFEKQLISLRCTSPQQFAAPFNNIKKDNDKLRFIHPIVENFSEFASVILGITISTIEVEKIAKDNKRYHYDSEDDSDDSYSNVDLPTEHDFDEVRSAALAEIAKEEGSDYADSSSHLSALVGTMSFLYIEVINFLEKCAAGVFRDASVGPFQNAFLLNNYYALVRVLAPYRLLEEDSPVEDHSFKSVKLKVEACRDQFVEDLIRCYFPVLYNMVKEVVPLTAAGVLDAALLFMAEWKTALDSLRMGVKSLIVQTEDEQEVIVQTCMELLLYNTRFHNCIAKFIEASPETFGTRTLRTLVVANQHLLQHMRTFSSVPNAEY